MFLTEARVHFQHSAELLSRLVRVEANYSLQLYPDEGHDLREPRSVHHFQRTVVNYLQTCLKHSAFLEPIEDDEEDDDWAESWKDSLWTEWLYALPWVGLPGTRAQEWGPNTSDHPTTSGKIDVLYIMLHIVISVTLYDWDTVCLQDVLDEDVDWKTTDSDKTFTETWKHACLNGCMMWISLHCILCVWQMIELRPSGLNL